MRYLAMGLMALGVATTSVEPATAAASTYNVSVQSIRAGVLLADRAAWANARPGENGAADPAHSFAYVFHALNARPDIRPYSWDILNPYAAPYLDQASAERWGIGPNTANPLAYNSADPPRLNKNMGAYWEVHWHGTPANRLANYDILYFPLPLHDPNNVVTPEDRENLRRAVDGGTILWLDFVGREIVTDPRAPANLGAKLFVQPSFQQAANRRPVSGDPLESILSTPNVMSTREIRGLGARGVNAWVTNLTDDIYAGRTLSWKQVAWDQGGATILAAPYGQGAIVITARALGRSLTEGFRPVTGTDSFPYYRTRNTGPVSASDTSRIPVPELKLLVNILAYRFQSPSEGQGPRHSSGSRQELNTPLGRKWQFPESRFNNPTPFVSDPAVWNGVMFAALGDGSLCAFDMEPGRDIDGDGNPDDGMPNVTASADILWREALPAPCSSITLADYNNILRVYVMLANGACVSYEALPRQNGRLLKTGATRKVGPVNPGFKEYKPLFPRAGSFVPVALEQDVMRIPAPVFYNGRLFVVGINDSANTASRGIGGIAELNPDTLEPMWQFPEETLGSGTQVPAQSRMGIPSATPTIAAVADKGYSGATDILLLVPTLSVRAEDTAGFLQASRLIAFPIAVRGEKLVFNGNINEPKWYTRFSQANAIASQNVRLWLRNGVGGTGTMLVENGSRRMYVEANIPAAQAYDVTADYDFRPLPPDAGFSGYNARWGFDAWAYTATGTPRYMEILTTPVVSSTGGIYFVASDLGQGANQSPIIMGLELSTPRFQYNPVTSSGLVAPLTLPQLTFLYSLGTGTNDFGIGGSIPQPITLGRPAIDRGILYVAAGHWDAGNSNASRGRVEGFYVQDSSFGLLLSQPVDLAQKGSVTVTQKNLITGDYQLVGAGLFDVDNVSIGNELRGVLTFRALSSGSGAASLDLSRPGDIQVTYQSVDVTTGRAQPYTDLSVSVYYKTIRGQGTDTSVLKAFSADVPSPRGGIRTGVAAAGRSIYVGADDGEIYTVPMPTEVELLSTARAGVMRPATYPGLPAAAGYNTNNYPIGFALRSTPVIANNTLVQNAPQGLYAFDSARTLITDANRIVEVVSSYEPEYVDPNNPNQFRKFNPSGSTVVWSLDSTNQTMDFGAPGAGPNHGPWAENRLTTPIIKSFNQPSMAIRVNSTNTLICDTGNNRVVEVDRSGNIVWQMSELADPSGLLSPNESRTLNAPSSVQRWESYEFDDEDRVIGRAQHTLIADSGNYRVVEVITRYSPDPNNWTDNVLVWVGRGAQGQNLQFYQATREPDANGNLDFGKTIASVINYSVNSADVRLSEPGYSNAALGLPPTPGGSLVILGARNTTGVDAGGNTVSAAGRIVYYFNRMIVGNNAQQFPLARPVFFSRYTSGPAVGSWALTITDGQNVFDVTKRDSDPAGVAYVPVDMNKLIAPFIANQSLGNISAQGIGTGGYTVGTVMAKRLANNNLLMVNRNTGYVLEFSPTAAQAGDLNSLLTFISPPLRGTSGLTRPVYADRLY